MTALPEYQRLESSGLWREVPDGQKREVLVTFGDATLVISDPRSERPLSHWSLPAVVRRTSAGAFPAVFAPGEDSGESLEIDDRDMVAAIGKVHHLIAARRPHPGRLRLTLAAGVAAALAALGLFWLPDALIRHTAAVLPPAKRAEIGQEVLRDLTRVTGRPCETPEGRAALDRLSGAISGAEHLSVVILPDSPVPARVLPGGLMAVSGAALASANGPDGLARLISAEAASADRGDALPGALRHAGLGATLRLLTTGDLPEDALAGYAERLLSRGTEGALPEGDVPPSPLTDTQWVAIQNICNG